MTDVATLQISAMHLKLYLAVTHDNILVPQDHNTNLNLFTRNDENEQNDNLPDIMSNIDSPYYDVQELNFQTANYDLTALHINIQSLPAKIDDLRLLIAELYDKNIEVDFILLCETF